MLYSNILSQLSTNLTCFIFAVLVAYWRRLQVRRVRRYHLKASRKTIYESKSNFINSEHPNMVTYELQVSDPKGKEAPGSNPGEVSYFSIIQSCDCME